MVWGDRFNLVISLILSHILKFKLSVQLIINETLTVVQYKQSVFSKIQIQFLLI